MNRTLEDIARQESMLTEEQQYDEIIQKLIEAKETGMPIQEGVFGAFIGGLTGMAIGPLITKAFCKVLGIDPKGQFGQVVTSRLVTTALGVEIGLNK